MYDKRRGKGEVADRNNGKGKDRARQSFVHHMWLFCLQFRDHPDTKSYHTSLLLLYQSLDSSFFNFLFSFFFCFQSRLCLKRCSDISKTHQVAAVVSKGTCCETHILFLFLSHLCFAYVHRYCRHTTSSPPQHSRSR